MGIKATPCHITPGRIRLRLAESVTDSALETVSQRLLALPATTAVRFSALTGSMVLHHNLATHEEYLDQLARQGEVNFLFPRGNGKALQGQAGQDFLRSVHRLDRRIMELTGGECNLRVAGAVAFTAMGLFQVGHGMGLPAGLTLLVNAARIMRIPMESKAAIEEVEKLC